MTLPQHELQFPTLDGALIMPIESPSSDEMYKIYGEIVLEIIGNNMTIDNNVKNAASKALDYKFFENPLTNYDSELWVSGAKSIYTLDKTMIKEITEATTATEHTQGILPDIVEIPLQETEEIQGFFKGFSTGLPIPLISYDNENLDFSFCVSLDNIAIRSPEDAITDIEPEVLIGNWHIMLNERPKFGIVHK